MNWFFWLPLSYERKCKVHSVGLIVWAFHCNIWYVNENYIFKTSNKTTFFSVLKTAKPLSLEKFSSAPFCSKDFFIPRREVRSISRRGPIVFTYVSFPEGRCEAYPVGVQLFLLMFYFVLGDELCEKKGHPITVILAEFFPQNVLFDGTGWDGMG